MRSVLIALALAFAAPAFADTPIKFPEKLQRTDFQAMIADAGPLYIAGQPTETALREMVTREGVKTVINLRTQQEMDNRKQVPFDEAAVLKELGVNYVHIPLGGPDTPYTPEAVETFAKALEGANTKVLLHCTVAWRASHMWAAYLVKHKGYTREEAEKAGNAMNMGGYKQGGVPLDGLLGVGAKPGGN